MLCLNKSFVFVHEWREKEKKKKNIFWNVSLKSYSWPFCWFAISSTNNVNLLHSTYFSVCSILYADWLSQYTPNIIRFYVGSSTHLISEVWIWVERVDWIMATEWVEQIYLYGTFAIQCTPGISSRIGVMRKF